MTLHERSLIVFVDGLHPFTRWMLVVGHGRECLRIVVFRFDQHVNLNVVVLTEGRRRGASLLQE